MPSVVKVKDYKIKEGGSITFQNRHKENCECLKIANLVNTKVSKFGKLSIYYIWNKQAFNFSSVPYLKCFEASQLEFQTVELC